MSDALARVVARLTASEVQPTPPEAPVIVMICGPRAPLVCVSSRGRIRRLTESTRSLASRGQREELAGTGADHPEDHSAVAVAAGWQYRHVRRPLKDRLDQLDGLERVGVEDHQDQIGPDIDDPLVRSLVLAADVGEPNLADAADHSLQRLPRVVDRIDQNDSDRVLQGHSVDSIGGNAPGSELGLPLARDRDSRTDQGGHSGSGTRPVLRFNVAVAAPVGDLGSGQFAGGTNSDLAPANAPGLGSSSAIGWSSRIFSGFLNP